MEKLRSSSPSETVHSLKRGTSREQLTEFDRTVVAACKTPDPTARIVPVAKPVVVPTSEEIDSAARAWLKEHLDAGLPEAIHGNPVLAEQHAQELNVQSIIAGARLRLVQSIPTQLRLGLPKSSSPATAGQWSVELLTGGTLSALSTAPEGNWPNAIYSTPLKTSRALSSPPRQDLLALVAGFERVRTSHYSTDPEAYDAALLYRLEQQRLAQAIQIVEQVCAISQSGRAENLANVLYGHFGQITATHQTIGEAVARLRSVNPHPRWQSWLSVTERERPKSAMPAAQSKAFAWRKRHRRYFARLNVV